MNTVNRVSYRAKVMGVEVDGHPVQCITQSLNDVSDWTDRMLKQHRKEVTIYITEERVMAVAKPKTHENGKTGKG